MSKPSFLRALTGRKERSPDAYIHDDEQTPKPASVYNQIAKNYLYLVFLKLKEKKRRHPY